MRCPNCNSRDYSKVNVVFADEERKGDALVLGGGFCAQCFALQLNYEDGSDE